MDDIVQVGAIALGVYLLVKNQQKTPTAQETGQPLSLPLATVGQQADCIRDAEGRWKRISIRQM